MDATLENIRRGTYRRRDGPCYQRGKHVRLDIVLETRSRKEQTFRGGVPIKGPFLVNKTFLKVHPQVSSSAEILY